MTLSTSSPLQEALQRLLDKLAAIQTEADTQMEGAGRVADSLDRLAEVFANLELQQTQQGRLADKLELLAAQLEKLNYFAAQNKPPKRSLENSFRTVVAGTRTVGQVMGIVASNVQAMVDSVIQAVEEFRSSKSN